MISKNKIIINNKWLYSEDKDKDFITVNLPHANKEVPYNYFDEKSYQFISYYKKNLNIEADENKRVFLNFDIGCNDLDLSQQVAPFGGQHPGRVGFAQDKIGRASCRERV